MRLAHASGKLQAKDVVAGRVQALDNINHTKIKIKNHLARAPIGQVAKVQAEDVVAGRAQALNARDGLDARREQRQA